MVSRQVSRQMADLGASVSGSPSQPGQGEDEQAPGQTQQEGPHVEHHPREPPHPICLQVAAWLNAGLCCTAEVSMHETAQSNVTRSTDACVHALGVPGVHVLLMRRYVCTAAYTVTCFISSVIGVSQQEDLSTGTQQVTQSTTSTQALSSQRTACTACTAYKHMCTESASGQQGGP